MFRIILLIFIFLYFSWNFFYWLVVNYIPFKNAQSVNLYNSYKVFEENSFSGFMNDNTQTWITYKESFWDVSLEKQTINSYSGIVLKLPYRWWHRYWDPIEIFVPVINDLWDIVQNDNAFSWVYLKYKNNLIQSWESYLIFWIDYNTITNVSQLTNTGLIQDNHNIFLNKFYLIKTNSIPADYILR
jgi:hypothetical protein